MKYLILSLIFFLNISCFSHNGKDKKKQEIYVIFSQKEFSLDINRLSGNQVIRILKSKNLKYKIKDPYNGAVVSKEPLWILSNYFIGAGFPKNQILRVIYNFSAWGSPGNEIEIEFKEKYYDTCVKMLSRKYGNPIRSVKGSNELLSWNANKNMKSSLKLISINKSSSLHFYEGAGLKMNKNAFYLLLRGRNFSNTKK